MLFVSSQHACVPAYMRVRCESNFLISRFLIFPICFLHRFFYYSLLLLLLLHSSYSLISPDRGIITGTPQRVSFTLDIIPCCAPRQLAHVDSICTLRELCNPFIHLFCFFALSSSLSFHPQHAHVRMYMCVPWHNACEITFYCDVNFNSTLAHTIIYAKRECAAHPPYLPLSRTMLANCHFSFVIII